MKISNVYQLARQEKSGGCHRVIFHKVEILERVFLPFLCIFERLSNVGAEKKECKARF